MRTYIFEKHAVKDKNGKMHIPELDRRDFASDKEAIIYAKAIGAEYVWSWHKDQNPHTVYRCSNSALDTETLAVIIKERDKHGKDMHDSAIIANQEIIAREAVEKELQNVQADYGERKAETERLRALVVYCHDCDADPGCICADGCMSERASLTQALRPQPDIDGGSDD